MTWDEKAEDYAVAHFTDEHRPTLENINGYRRFAAGARWQRAQLLSAEAVERVAAETIESFGDDDHPTIDNLVVNDDGTVDLEGSFSPEVIARAAINALLGEEK